MPRNSLEHGSNWRLDVRSSHQLGATQGGTLVTAAAAWQKKDLQRWMKRVIDVVVAAVGLVLLAPVLAVLLALVRLGLGSPTLFVQPRPGLHGQSFRMFKIRTMRNARGADGLPLPDADRLTPLGKWLRSTSLDELPELWNVLKGEMSVVGPRPLLMEYLELYDKEQRRRHDMPPGITGLAAVSGRNALSWDEKFRLDLWYIDHWSLWLDAQILARTLLKVMRREGINEPGQATMRPFRGSGPSCHRSES